MKPDILNRRWKYVRAIDTDIRKGFEETRKRFRAERERSEALIEAAKKQTDAIEAEAAEKVAKTRIRGKVT